MQTGIIAAALALLSTVASAQNTLVVPATSNIFLAAPTSESGNGTVPVGIAITPGTQCVKLRAVQGSLSCFAANGCVSLNNGYNLNDPDGRHSQFGTTINSGTTLISGITSPGAAFLAGVFIADSSAGPAPAALDFTVAKGTAFKTLAPLLDQSFFIGDGRRGHAQGGVQGFSAPAGATRLALGLIDTCNGNQGTDDPPGCYQDNVGAYTVTVDRSTRPCEGVE